MPIILRKSSTRNSTNSLIKKRASMITVEVVLFRQSRKIEKNPAKAIVLVFSEQLERVSKL